MFKIFSFHENFKNSSQQIFIYGWWWNLTVIILTVIILWKSQYSKLKSEAYYTPGAIFGPFHLSYCKIRKRTSPFKGVIRNRSLTDPNQTQKVRNDKFMRGQDKKTWIWFFHSRGQNFNNKVMVFYYSNKTFQDDIETLWNMSPGIFMVVILLSNYYKTWINDREIEIFC